MRQIIRPTDRQTVTPCAGPAVLALIQNLFHSYIMLTVNDTHTHCFRFTQADVEAFAQITGDNNPLHLDADYAAGTPFRRPIIHGMLGASVFTKVLGTEFPGHGSVYMKQTLEFLRPMFVETDYEVTFTVQSIDAGRHTAEILGEVRDAQTGKVTTRGVATLMHREKIG